MVWCSFARAKKWPFIRSHDKHGDTLWGIAGLRARTLLQGVFLTTGSVVISATQETHHHPGSAGVVCFSELRETKGVYIVVSL